MKVELIDYTENVEELISEMAAICYDSKGANIKRLKHDGHFATFRFGHVTFQFSEFSRACSMQVLRHKFLDFLQRSQRYVKEFQFEYVYPPSIESNIEAMAIYDDIHTEIQKVYDALISMKVKAEDARYVLPNSAYTKMNVTGSIQAWHDFLHGDAGRLQPAAQWEIRGIAKQVDKELKKVAPSIFDGTGEYRPWLKEK